MRTRLQFLQKWGVFLVGCVLIVMGLILFPLPVPFGLPCMLLGTLLVVRTSYRAKRHVIRRGYHESAIAQRLRGKRKKYREE